MPPQFTRATKKRAKLRLAAFGPAGGGKTFTALRIATGLGGKIAFIDSERGSASKYADRFAFDVLELESRTIADYLAAMKAAAQAGYPVLIIDSISHGWQELLEEIDRLAKTKFKGNTWSAWSEGTPKQRKFVDAIQQYPGHVIATIRSKTEWMVEEGQNGKKTPIRVGLAPETGKGIEYEFDLLLELSPEHYGRVLKDRTGKFQDAVLDKPGEEFGQQLAAWLDEGEDAPAPKPLPDLPKSPTMATVDAIARVRTLCLEKAVSIEKISAHYSVETLDDLTAEQAEAALRKLEKQAKPQPALPGVA
jgi:hypothetical protein